MLRAVIVVLLLVLAGCQAPGGPGPADPGPTTGDGSATEQTPGSAAGGGAENASNGGVPDDPERDRLGWENGYWHNESLDVTAEDGYNESELEAVVARSMARMELVRQLEFEESVPVDVITRAEYRAQSGGNHSAALERFDNAKFEALFLVGERDDSIDTQDSARGENVLGYYSPGEDAIVVVSDSDTPRLDGEGTLAHELVHALQDQHFDLAADPAQTRDAYQGRNGLIEGDASFAQRQYEARCGDEWRCLDGADGESADAAGNESVDGDAAESGGGAGHLGIQFLMYFPYSDGPGFVQSLYDDGGWDAVNDAYADRPDGSPEIIYPERYSEWEPETVELRDRSNGAWDRVEPPNRPSYGVPGQSAIAASLAYTLADDYERAAVVRPADVINYRADDSVDPEDPFEYDVEAAAGWTGGKLYVYENGDDELGYVWRTTWENASEAGEFARTWSAVVSHWGGERVDDADGGAGDVADDSGDDGAVDGDERASGVWVIDDSPFADAIRIERDGDTVTVVNAPERADLSAVHDA